MLSEKNGGASHVIKDVPLDRGFRPSDIYPMRRSYYGRAEDDALLCVLIDIFKRNGNQWRMARDQFEGVIQKISKSAQPGGLTTFIGANSLERIKSLGALNIGEEVVAFDNNVLDFQIRNLKLLPELRMRVRKAFRKVEQKKA